MNLVSKIIIQRREDGEADKTSSLQNQENIEIAGTDTDNEYEKKYYGRNRYKWSSKSFICRNRTSKHNLVIKLSGLKQSAEIIKADFKATYFYSHQKYRR